MGLSALRANSGFDYVIRTCDCEHRFSAIFFFFREWASDKKKSMGKDNTKVPLAFTSLLDDLIVEGIDVMFASRSGPESISEQVSVYVHHSLHLDQGQQAVRWAHLGRVSCLEFFLWCKLLVWVTQKSHQGKGVQFEEVGSDDLKGTRRLGLWWWWWRWR